MSRGYPDFLITPAYAKFGPLEMIVFPWNDIPAGDTDYTTEITGQGSVEHGYLRFRANSEAQLKVLPSVIIDGTTIGMPYLYEKDLYQSFGETGLIWTFSQYGWYEGWTYCTVILRGGLTWGSSFMIGVFNDTLFDIDWYYEIFYRRVAGP